MTFRIKTFTPILVGLFLEIGIPLILAQLRIGGSSQQALFFSIAFIVLVRIVSMLTVNNFCGTYDIIKAKIVWILLALVFGGWSLIPFNIALWLQKKTVDDEDDH